ncbi:hypothetical protein [Sulfitobacter sp. S190]|uniref:hypothetical protein n=1 Tax=Sulfitobacter sp. S190 TaxID=2867022 RepID=UPI0021A7E1B4|nr:hypothetical protein [Sulfitobacter sp. S190]UWR21291.1 hypothetical protein K3756_11265 [Sulfitobacter sp. S190]
MIETVYFNNFEIRYLEMFYVALSEPTHDLRMRAIANVRHEVEAETDSFLVEDHAAGRIKVPSIDEHYKKMALAARKRDVAKRCLFETEARFTGSGKASNQRRLETADLIGMKILTSILDKKYDGVYSETGILQQVREQSIRENLNVFKDHDSLRKIWKQYRGIVHLSIALGLEEDRSTGRREVIKVAEAYRQILSSSCPRGTQTPYVALSEQILFL